MGSQGPSNKEVLLDAVEQTVGPEALEIIEPTSDVPDPISSAYDNVKKLDIPICVTQLPIPIALANGPSDIVVGLENQVPRWVPGSVIKWSAWRMGFQSQEDADYAAGQLLIATEAWNQADVGVTFEWVALAKDATFVLCHGGAQGTVLASAFFPNSKDLNYMRVYKWAFSSGWKENMWKVFTHELGHVLGLRHEFAIGDVPVPRGISIEARMGAVRVDEPDPLSVMNYRQEPPEIQQSDIESTRKFYSMVDDANGKAPKIGRSDVVDYTPC